MVARKREKPDTKASDPWRRHLVTDISTEVGFEEVRAFSYSYDALGRLVSRNGDDFAYNARSEVTNAIFHSPVSILNSYAYDPAGNRMASDCGGAASTYAANSLNQYVAIMSGGATNTLVHDAWGNLAGTRNFAYNHMWENRLVNIDTNGASGPAALADCDYDAQGRRTAKFLYGTPYRLLNYFHTGWSLVAETIEQPGQPTARRNYVWGRDLSGTLDGAGGVGAMHNAQCTMHNSPGTNEGPPRPHSLCIVHYALCIDVGYRYYSPELGRWITRDPIEEDGGDNLYAFCGNYGVDKVDYFGLYRQ